MTFPYLHYNLGVCFFAGRNPDPSRIWLLTWILIGIPKEFWYHLSPSESQTCWTFCKSSQLCLTNELVFSTTGPALLSLLTFNKDDVLINFSYKILQVLNYIPESFYCLFKHNKPWIARVQWQKSSQGWSYMFWCAWSFAKSEGMVLT